MKPTAFKADPAADDLVAAVREQPAGTRFWFWGNNYIYAGVPLRITDRQVRLGQPEVVYETGDLTSGPLEDSQAISEPFSLERHHIESWGRCKA